MASAKQIKAIHTLKSRLHIEDEEYKNNLAKYGVHSSTDENFTEQMAGDFIKGLSDTMKKLQPNSPTSYKQGQPHDRPASSSAGHRYTGKGKRGSQQHLTPAQAERIGILEDMLGWNTVRVNSFIFKQTGQQSTVEMLMNYQAMKVIVGMQRIYCAGDPVKYKIINVKSNAQLKEWAVSSRQ